MDDENEISWTYTGTMTMSSPVVSAFKFFSDGGNPFLTITADGRIEIGEGLSPDEAGRQAIDAMQHQLTFILDKRAQEEREACARIADEHSKTYSYAFRDGDGADAIAIADAIRARGSKGPT